MCLRSQLKSFFFFLGEDLRRVLHRLAPYKLRVAGSNLALLRGLYCTFQDLWFLLLTSTTYLSWLESCGCRCLLAPMLGSWDSSRRGPFALA